jgi:hypothetical protein
MNNPLVEALAQMNLEPGRTYCYDVNGRQVVVRVLEQPPPEMMPAPLNESDVMLDAWVELPEPAEGIVTASRLGEPDLPDPPVIPKDEAEE